MAKGKPKPRKSGKKPQNVRVNQLHHAIAMRPKRARLVADPPLRSMTLEQSAVIRLHCYGQGSDTTLELPVNRYVPATLKQTVGKGYYELSAIQILALIKSFANLESTTDLEFTLRKISVWGPIPSPGTDETYPCLAADVGSNSAGLTVSDRSAPNHRSRCGITFPYTVWHPGTSTKLLRYAPGGETRTHIMDLSLAWRISRSL